MKLTERIKIKAVELGFDLVGIAPAARAPTPKPLNNGLITITTLKCCGWQEIPTPAGSPVSH